MFVDPKVSFTQRVADPAAAIRKARILLDYQLRQDAAFNRQVSRARYQLGPSITCLITHEFGRTYIELDQSVSAAQGAENRTLPYQFLTILMDINSWPYTHLTAWLSRDGNAWTQVYVPPVVVGCLQAGSGALLQLSKSQLFLVGQFGANAPYGQVSWALLDSQTLSPGFIQPLPPINGNQVIKSANGAFVGGTVVCVALGTSVGNFLVWFDYAKSQYIYVLPYTALNVPNTLAYLSYVLPTALTRAPGKSYSQAAFSVVASGQLSFCVADANTSSFQSFGGVSYNYAGADFPLLAAGLGGQLGVSMPTASSTQPSIQTGTDYYIYAGAPGALRSAASYPRIGLGFWYTPIGWATYFWDNPAALYFLSSDGALLGMVQRNSNTAGFTRLVVTPRGVYDVLGGGLYLSPQQGNAIPLALPPYSDPASPAYALGFGAGLYTQAFYLGAQISPWLNLY